MKGVLLINAGMTYNLKQGLDVTSGGWRLSPSRDPEKYCKAIFECLKHVGMPPLCNREFNELLIDKRKIGYEYQGKSKLACYLHNSIKHAVQHEYLTCFMLPVTSTAIDWLEYDENDC